MARRSESEVPATERGRSPSGEAGTPRTGGGRWTAQRKLEVVLRLLKGESLDQLSRELQVTAARLSQWRTEVLASAETSLKCRERDARDEELARLRAKVGELTMDNEVLEMKIAHLEPGLRPRPRRSRR